MESVHSEDGAEHLVQDLNKLLESLSLPFTLTTPYDLTPSLLIAILESILRARLPIPNTTRESRSPAAKIEIMKILLGVLEDDILRVDIGLSEIDPRRLAAGEWDDLVFVGEVLCWVAHHYRQSQSQTAEGHAESSSAGSNGNTSTYTRFAQHGVSESSATTVPREVNLHTIPRDPPAQSRAFFPRQSCWVNRNQSIRDSDSEAFCDCSGQACHGQTSPALTAWFDRPSPLPAVRYEGFIGLAHDDVPLFEAWQEESRARQASILSAENQVHRDDKLPTLSASPHYTRYLLQKRTRLLEELAKLKAQAVEHVHDQGTQLTSRP